MICDEGQYKAWALDKLDQGETLCECGEPGGCERRAVDVWLAPDDTTYALCNRCLLPDHGRSEP